MVPAGVLARFGYPDTLICEYTYWYVLAQRRPLTLGALLVVYRGDATTLGAIATEAWSEFGAVLRDVEVALARVFAPDRMNLLFLMMATPEAHAAILPRYAGSREFQGTTFTDPGWPRKPDLDATHDLDVTQFGTLVADLRAAFAHAPCAVPVV